MDKLPICRVCLAGNVQMYLILNKNLRKLYKKLTGIQFVTPDRRPIIACYFCCTRLKQCFQLQKQCREAEELFARMMSEDIMPKPLTNPDGLKFYKGFVQTPVVHINISDESQVEYDAIKLGLPESLDDIAELNKDPLSDENLDCSCLHEEEISAHHPEPYSEDDVPLMEIKTEVEEELEVSEKNQRANDLHGKGDEPKMDKLRLGDAVAINRRVHTGRRKLDDGITEEENNTEQSDSKIDPEIDKLPPRPGLNINKPSSYAKPEVNNISLDNGANNEDKSSKSNKSMDSDDVNKRRVQSVKGYDLDKLREQGDKERENKLICDTCSRIFSHQRTLITHIRTHTGEKPFKCDICERSFHCKAYLIKHIRVHTGEKPYKCNICQSSFIRKTNLKKHIPVHTGEKAYKCTICQSSFNRRSNLEKHIRLHTGEKPYKCTICRSSFIQKKNLTVHMRIHTGEKPYKCDICERSFNQKFNLIRHVRIHTGEKPHKCTICPSSYSQIYDLSKHMRIHTGDKPFKCDICERSFNQKAILRRHTRIHTGENPHKCTICQSSFNRKDMLTTHMQIHAGEKPYMCAICQSSFNHKDMLTTHMRIHAGGKPYECAICRRSFNNKDMLTTHMRIHAGGKPYECDICQSTFKLKIDLTTHMRNHIEEILTNVTSVSDVLIIRRPCKIIIVYTLENLICVVYVGVVLFKRKT